MAVYAGKEAEDSSMGWHLRKPSQDRRSGLLWKGWSQPSRRPALSPLLNAGWENGTKSGEKWGLEGENLKPRMCVSCCLTIRMCEYSLQEHRCPGRIRGGKEKSYVRTLFLSADLFLFFPKSSCLVCQPSLNSIFSILLFFLPHFCAPKHK